ncbi:uncharacterized protein C8Q71DRAFT_757991 [Rhodofomes roseus]|uniref:Uncharacterized protein n=1 Tax=Rhodofomes roseus TaxID=34475 RepID=A0ABQ8KI98_9APHY|nr:uncharacterized protein C8Q71DRAFT_757991 [Rhodofomes roseus]KAH9837391.1 hypothetical protein C8Q71DRAFT_757991 [Rhodofomes roseus]
MRLTPSSSLLIATLALSSSSSSLAAPTDSDVNELSSSSSMHGIHSSSRRDSMNMHVSDGGINMNLDQDQPRPDRERHRVYQKRLDLGAVLSGVPILGPALAPLLPALEPIFAALGLGAAANGGPSALLALTPGQVGQVQQAVAQAILSAGPANVTGITASLPVPPLPTGVVTNITANVPVGKRDDCDYSGGNMASDCSSTGSPSGVSSTWSPVSTFAAFSAPSNVPLDGPAAFAAPSGLPVSPPTGLIPVGANPLSPSLPVNPPNTPVALPIPVGPFNGSASSASSSAGTTPTAAPEEIDIDNDTTPPLFMSSTAPYPPPTPLF